MGGKARGSTGKWFWGCIIELFFEFIYLEIMVNLTTVWAASAKALPPSQSLSWIFAPLESNNFTIVRRPSWATLCKAGAPWLFLSLPFAPLESNNSTTVRCPFWAVTAKAVEPWLHFSLTRAPLDSYNLITWICPPWDSFHKGKVPFIVLNLGAFATKKIMVKLLLS